MSTQSYRKGDLVWYRQRDGTFTEAKVDNVDLSVRPVSYGITLQSSDHYRETESPRLKHRTPGEEPPPSEQPAEGDQHLAAPAPAGEDEEDDEFGSFSEAVATPPTDSSLAQEPANAQQPVQSVPASDTAAAERAQQSTQNVGPPLADEDTDWRFSKWRPNTAKAAFSNPQKQARQSEPPPERVKLHTVKTAFKPPPAAADFDDDAEFGDFSGAEILRPEEPQEEEQGTRAGPIPLSIFGEEEAEEHPQPASWDLSTPWSGAALGIQQPQPLLTGHEFRLQQPQIQTGSMATSGALPVKEGSLSQASRLPALILNGTGTSLTPVRWGPVAPAAGRSDQLPANFSLANGNGLGGFPGYFQPAAPQRLPLDLLPKQRDALPQPEGPPALASVLPDPRWYQRPITASSQPPVLLNLSTAEPTYNGGGEAASPPGGSDNEFGDFEEGGAWPEEPATVAVALGTNRLAPALPHPSDSQPALPALPISALHSSSHSRQLGPSAVAQLTQQVGRFGLQEEEEPGEVPWYMDPDSFGQQGAPSAIAENGGAPWLQAGALGQPQPPLLAFDTQPLQPAVNPALMDLMARQNLWQQPQAQPDWGGSLLGGLDDQPVSYVDAWTQLMQACAAELERGRAILQEVERRGASDRFFASPRGGEFVRALGQLFLAVQILETAMNTHVAAGRWPPSFSNSLRRCSHAWTQGPLGDAVGRVAPLIRQQSVELPLQAAGALSQQPRWGAVRQAEQPEWEDGLCGVCLLPLEQLQPLHVAPWLDERPCLVLLANLWSHRVQDAAPSLRGW